jgi:hypothetical protein
MTAVTHRLKTHPAAFYAVRDNLKPFEVRKNDRLFQRGDFVELYFWDPDQPPGQRGRDENGRTPKPVTRQIGWVLGGGQYGVEPGHIAFTLEDPVGLPKRFEDLKDMLTRYQKAGTEVLRALNSGDPIGTVKASAAVKLLRFTNENAAKMLAIESLPVDLKLSPEGSAHG